MDLSSSARERLPCRQSCYDVLPPCGRLDSTVPSLPRTDFKPFCQLLFRSCIVHEVGFPEHGRTGLDEPAEQVVFVSIAERPVLVGEDAWSPPAKTIKYWSASRMPSKAARRSSLVVIPSGLSSSVPVM